MDTIAMLEERVDKLGTRPWPHINSECLFFLAYLPNSKKQFMKTLGGKQLQLTFFCYCTVFNFKNMVIIKVSRE